MQRSYFKISFLFLIFRVIVGFNSTDEIDPIGSVVISSGGVSRILQTSAASLCSNGFSASDGQDGPIIQISSIQLNPSLTLLYDPPNNHFEPTALGVFVRSSDPSALIYYDSTDHDPTLLSACASYDSPFIVLTTPFKGSRNRTLSIVAVSQDLSGNLFRSEQYYLKYAVESAARPHSFGFMVPGVQSGGYFMKFVLEAVATARATTGSQEFADFFNSNGIGTYLSQIRALQLTQLDPDLTGFEGGFPTNTSASSFHGYLIPFHNGRSHSGKLVRIDLKNMDDNITCIQNYRQEYYLNGDVKVDGPASSSEACVFVVDLTTLHPLARGFRRGFVNYPYGYLSAGENSVLVRINVEDFGLHSTRIINAANLDSTFGGYSGGFADGTWACFSPFKTFTGPVGGLRSNLMVDANRLTPYYYSVMLCVNESLWNAQESAITPAVLLATKPQAFVLDFSIVDVSLRGFSDGIRVGRYAFLCPLSSADHVYTSNLVRLDLGDVDIGTKAAEVFARGGSVRDLVDVLDLSQVDNRLRGFTGLFTSGNYLFLVPFRNAYEPRNGQRGHGVLTRLDMNQFSLSAVDIADLPVATRQQVPSFQDLNLRGFIGGFASGQYGLLVPFYNGNFDGKVARFQPLDPQGSLNASVQELDLTLDRVRPGVYKGYRGGFVSIWQGVDF